MEVPTLRGDGAGAVKSGSSASSASSSFNAERIWLAIFSSWLRAISMIGGASGRAGGAGAGSAASGAAVCPAASAAAGASSSGAASASACRWAASRCSGVVIKFSTCAVLLLLLFLLFLEAMVRCPPSVP